MESGLLAQKNSRAPFVRITKLQVNFRVTNYSFVPELELIKSSQ